MIKLGRYQELEIGRRCDYGFYLIDEEEDEVLLPNRFVTDEMKKGDTIKVFIYKDSEDRLTATTQHPKITCDNIAKLQVKEVTNIGAFMDWGLDKDLLLPYKEQRQKVEAGKSYWVAMYIDRSERLCATTKIYNVLSSNSPYTRDDRVKGIIYAERPEMGLLVAVDGKYHGLIQIKNVVGNYGVGDEVELRVTSVRSDGKLNLCPGDKSYRAIEGDAKIILEAIIAAGGFLPFNDKSDANAVKRRFRMSKNAFKKALGRLYKERHIVFEGDGVKLVEKKH